jgi:hypothetical protein
MLVTALSGQLGRDVIHMLSHAGAVLPSHANDGATGVTWLRRDVYVESCWQRRCLGDLVAAQCICRVMLATALLGRLGRGAM